MTSASRVMLLIDADNVSTDVIEQAISRLHAEYGALHVRRAYCTAESAVKHQNLFKRLSIRPMVNLAAGKNSTDIALAVDALDLVMAERPDVVVIASSDSDFAPLVSRLREKGCQVRGVGQAGKVGEETPLIYDDFLEFSHRRTRSAAGDDAPAAGKRSRSGSRSTSRGGSRGKGRQESRPGHRTDEAAPAVAETPRAEAPAPAPAGTADAAEAVQAPAPAATAASRRKRPARTTAKTVAEAPAAPEVAATPAAAAGAGDTPATANEEAVPVKPARKTAARKTAVRKTAKAAVELAEVAEPAEPTNAPPAEPEAPAAKPARKRAATPRKTAARKTAAAEVEPPAPPPAPPMPAEVAELLRALPALAETQVMELQRASEQLRRAGLLSKRYSSRKLLGRFPDWFDLQPPQDPVRVVLRKKA